MMGLVLCLSFSTVSHSAFLPSKRADSARIGELVGNLSFKDIRYLPRSLDDFVHAKAFVLVFTDTSCPVARQYWPALKSLETEFRPQGAQFVALNVGALDTIQAMAAHAIQFGVEFPMVKDIDGSCAAALGVKRVPVVVVLDKDRRLRYRGRIDDQFRMSGARSKATRHDLKDALLAVLAGKTVDVPETAVDGCLLTRANEGNTSENFTYAENVAPILNKHCVECHRPNTTAPFSLATYKSASARADMIAEVVAEGRMPPWYASAEHGHFVNKRELSKSEQDTLVHWAASGAPMGDSAKLPKLDLSAFGDARWQIDKPDLIVRTLLTDKLPATGDVAYRYAILPYVFPEETWVDGVQILPDNPRVVHHCNLAFFTAKEGFKQANFITGTVPGGEAMRLEDGVAFRIPKGAGLVLQIHFVTTGKEESCRLAVGFRYAKGVVRKRLHHAYLVDNKFEIPPGAPAHPVKASRTLPCNAEGIGMFAHMHVRGKDITFLAHRPDGKTETLLVVPNYSFDWQMPYRWELGKMKFPKGTRLECIAHYDNSAFNPFNPDPTDTVREGPQTYHEMMNGFVFYTDADEDLKLRIDPKTGRVSRSERN
jgi:peroxiredoxin